MFIKCFKIPVSHINCTFNKLQSINHPLKCLFDNHTPLIIVYHIKDGLEFTVKKIVSIYFTAAILHNFVLFSCLSVSASIIV